MSTIILKRTIKKRSGVVSNRLTSFETSSKLQKRRARTLPRWYLAARWETSAVCRGGLTPGPPVHLHIAT